MYWGSVRFFKHLILVFFFGLLVFLFGLSIFFGLRYKRLQSSYAVTQQDQSVLSESISREEDVLQSLMAGDTAPFLAFCQERGVDTQRLQVEKGLVVSADMPEYTQLFPELYAESPTRADSADNTAYLTFDDGPSENTGFVLDTLKKYGVKATFFVCPKADGSDADDLRRIVAEGHTLGIHSGSHVYTEIYQDVPSFLADFAAASDRVYAATGLRPDIFRFPGGSINSYNRLLYRDLISEMTRRGFTYYDWNVSGNEEAGHLTSDMVSDAVLMQSEGKKRAFILLHDGGGRGATAHAVGTIIEGLQAKGFAFDCITSTVKPVIIGYTSG